MASAQHDAGWYVVGVQLQARAQQLQGPSDIAVLTMDLGQRGEGETLGVFGVATLEFFNFGCGHRSRYSRSGLQWEVRQLVCGKHVRVVERAPGCQLLSGVAP